MQATELLKEGRLDDALDALQGQVRAQPAEARHRIFLFQLLCVLGQWERAFKQLRLCGELDPAALAMVHTYGDALQCEALRTRIFSGDRSPVVFGEPQEWIAQLSEALKLDAAGNASGAEAMRASAFDAAPPSAGTINGVSFDWIADGDSRLGPVLEAVVGGSYYWIPFANMSRIRIEAPEDLRDLVWTPAYLTWSNGGEAAALIPTRYAGTDTADDNQLRLARRTEWRELAGDYCAGIGQRMFLTNEGEYPLLEVRDVLFSSGEAGAESGEIADD